MYLLFAHLFILSIIIFFIIIFIFVEYDRLALEHCVCASDAAVTAHHLCVGGECRVTCAQYVLIWSQFDRSWT